MRKLLAALIALVCLTLSAKADTVNLACVGSANKKDFDLIRDAINHNNKEAVVKLVLSERPRLFEKGAIVP